MKKKLLTQLVCEKKCQVQSKNIQILLYHGLKELKDKNSTI